MTSPIKVGIVGLSTKGWAATASVPALLQPPLDSKYKLVALSTTSEKSAKATAEKYSAQLGHKVKAYHGDSALIAGDPEVDLVVVSVKTPLHKETILPVIAQKKNFFLEWPAGRGLKETLEIAEAAKKQGVKSIIGLQARNSPVIQKIKQLVSSGKIGPIRSTVVVGFVPSDVHFWPPQVDRQSLYTVKKDNGATALSIGIGHQLDPMIYILGEFSTVSATATTVYPNAEIVESDGTHTGETIPAESPDHYTISGILKSGAIASIVWRTGYKRSPGRKGLLWEIHGEDGVIRVECDDQPFVGVSYPDVYLNGEKLHIDGTEGHAIVGILAAAWKAYADGEDHQYATIDDAIKAHRVIDAVHRSVEEGRTIVL